MPLFSGDIEQLRQYVPVTVNFTPDDLMPQLQSTADDLINRFLGEGLGQQLTELAEPDLSTDDRRTERQALHLFRTAVGKIGMAAHLPFAEVQIGDEGVTITGGNTRKAAFQYQTIKIEQSLLDTGWRALDELIALVARQTTLFPGWAGSPYHDEYQDATFPGPADFSQYYPIQNRWLTYWALRPFIRAVETDWGIDSLARLDSLPDSVTNAQRQKLERTRKRALAYQSVLAALPALSIELNGVNVQVNYASQFGNAQYYEAPGKDHLTWVMTNLQAQADLAWNSFNDTLTALTAAPPPTDTPTGLVNFDGPLFML